MSALRVMALALLVLGGCSSKTAPSTPADATLSEQEYVNRYFGFRLGIPDGWSVAPVETQDELRRAGRVAIAGDDAASLAAIEQQCLEQSEQLVSQWQRLFAANRGGEGI